MSSEYEAAFKGTREMAVSAMHRVQQQLQTLQQDGSKDSNRHEIQLALSTLRTICTVAAKPEGQHYAVYCDTLVHVLGKHIQPTMSTKYWTMYLEHLRYLHHLVADKKMFTEAKSICDLVASYANYLKSEGDYKIVLGMFLQHLLCQHSHVRLNAQLAQEHIISILEALKELFVRMLQCNKSENFTYPELITDFIQYLVPKRVSTVFNYLATLSANKTQMYDAFFVLLKDERTLQPSKEVLQAHCQRHLEALTVFFQLDVPDRLQQQLALRHLRACREMSVFASDKSANYVFSLLYYLVKLVYGLPNPGEFQDIYKDLSQKLTTFFERYGELLMQERWFTDVPVIIAVLLTQMQQHLTTPFTFFWQHMNSIECYISHFEIILSCIRLAPRITETKLLKFDCCTSARKHTIISFVVSSLAAFSSYAAAVDDTTQESAELFVSFRTQLLTLMRHGVSVLDSLACITPDTAELKLIYARIVQLTLDMRTPAQKRLCITLAEFLLRIRHKFAIKDWTMLLRRLYKMTLETKETTLTLDLHVAHIASMLQESAWPDINTLRTRIGHFHTASPYVSPGQCILQLAMESHSPFKVFLEAPQKHLLHWLETQQYLKYHKSSEQLQTTLMRCSPSLYAEVLVARGAGVGGALPNAVLTRLQQLRKELEQKIEKTAGLTRLEQLCWAHINTALLHDAWKVRKSTLAAEIKFQEDTLEDIWQRKELNTITVEHEIKFIKQAELALQAFRVFYEKADSEPILSNEVYIDWESIVEDLTSLALYMQLAGYLDVATDAWLLHYRITNLIDDDYNSIRSLSYFCENSVYFQNAQNAIDLRIEVPHKQKFLLHALKQLPTLIKRYQNHVLMCLCQMAHYYARTGHLNYAQALLQYVQQAHATLPNQQGKYNVVLGTVDIVKFRILWKHLDSVVDRGDTQLSQRCLLREMEDTLERFRGDFFKLSNSELVSYTILLLSLVEEVAECAANRLCDHFVNSYFAGTFKLLLQSGSALRIIQMLAMWAWINLQMEYVQKAQIKIKLIEYILGAKNIDDLRQLSEARAAEKKLAAPNGYNTAELLHSGVEPLRKMIPLYASPIKTLKIPLSPSVQAESSLKRYLQLTSNDTLQQYEILQWCCFMVGCLNARLYFLADNHDKLEDFYDSSQQWLEQHEQSKQHNFLRIKFQNIQLLSMQHYVNYLRMHKKYEKALSCLEAGLHRYTSVKGNVDTVYHINFLLQLRATKKELAAKKEAKSHGGLRRALAFNVSPDLENATLLAAPVVAPIKTAKKVPVAAFKIYDSDESLNKHTPKRAAIAPLPEVSKTKEKTLSLTARKTRKLLATETPAKTGVTNGIKSSTKSLTARKLRELRAAAGDLHSNSSNSTPDSDADNILNLCQRIESVDLVDSDDAGSGKHNEVANLETMSNNKRSVRKASRHNENLLNICRKIESIDLAGDEEPALASTKRVSTKVKEEKDCKRIHTPEVIDISDDTDSFKTPDSTFGKLTAPPKTTTNTKGSTKKASRAAQSRRNSRETNTNDASVEVSASSAAGETTTLIPCEPQIQVVEKIKITEDKKSTTTKTRTRTKTEVRTLKVITRETEIKILSPAAQAASKDKQSANATRGRARATRKAASNDNNDENVAPPVTVSRTLSRRARQ
ncbi:protein three rows [Zeugodacus cucurbitae]|uniref:protein three rows n=1 Tax=Zeugodacus cucurbitae TaxID=28588 RepID=UPI0023D94DCC|nr:protein three rows [Zeugodacus cucurbitae]